MQCSQKRGLESSVGGVRNDISECLITAVPMRMNAEHGWVPFQYSFLLPPPPSLLPFPLLPPPPPPPPLIINLFI